MEPKTITASNLSEQEIRQRLDDYFSSGYSIKDYCYLNEDIDESTLTLLLQEHHGGQENDDEDDGFMTVNIIEEKKRRGRPRQQATSSLSQQPLFARIGDIELYYHVSAAYLKSLKA